MGDVVLKAINTVNRRLRVGDPISEADDLTPHTYVGLKDRGFIGSAAAPSAPSRFAKAAAMKGDDE